MRFITVHPILDSMQKPHIVIAVTLAEPGGVQTFIVLFSQWLVAQGTDVTIVAGDGTWLADQARAHNIPYVQLKHMGRSINPWRDLRAGIELVRVLKRLRPTSVDLNSSKMGIVGSIAGRIARIPQITYRIGGWVFLEPLPRFTKWLYIALEWFTAHFKDTIIVLHPDDEAIAKRYHFRPRKELVIVPNGVDLPVFDAHLLSRTDARARMRIDPNAFVFGTIANFYPPKDLPAYIDACARVHATDPETLFVLVGDGQLRPAIEERIRAHHLEQHALLVGSLEAAQTYLRAFDVFVLPSAKEGMPWVMLEAMAARVPCVATDVGANAWMTAGTARIVPPRNTQALADAMIELARTPSLREHLAQAARAHVEATFPLEATLKGNARSLL